VQQSTGSDAFDGIIDEATRGDVLALASRAILTEIECESQPGDAAALRCPDGAADGDTFEVFTSVDCHAGRHLADRVVAAFSAFDSSEDVALYAVTEQPLGGSGLPVAAYKLIFKIGDRGVALWADRDGGIALLERACGVDLGPEVLLDDGVPSLVGPLM
jgi:hypothetical protein